VGDRLVRRRMEIPVERTFRLEFHCTRETSCPSPRTSFSARSAGSSPAT
jgi:hypothetical protein